MTEQKVRRAIDFALCRTFFLSVVLFSPYSTFFYILWYCFALCRGFCALSYLLSFALYYFLSRGFCPWCVVLFAICAVRFVSVVVCFALPFLCSPKLAISRFWHAFFSVLNSKVQRVGYLGSFSVYTCSFWFCAPTQNACLGSPLKE